MSFSGELSGKIRGYVCRSAGETIADTDSHYRLFAFDPDRSSTMLN